MEVKFRLERLGEGEGADGCVCNNCLSHASLLQLVSQPRQRFVEAYADRSCGLLYIQETADEPVSEPQKHVAPPSTTTSAPVVYRPLLCPLSITTAPVNSSTLPIRPIGHLLAQTSRTACRLSPAFKTVSMYPGLIQLTLMPWTAHSAARFLVR